MRSRKLNGALLAGLATGAGLLGASLAGNASADVVIGNWEGLVTPPPPDPVPPPANFHRPIGSAGTDGWVDWQNRGVYTRDTYGATNGQFSLKMLTADDGGQRWSQSLAIALHGNGYVDDFLTSGRFAIDVSWRESDFIEGGTWSQVENLYVNSPSTGFVGRGRATTDSHNDPPWNGSWDPTNFDDDTRTLTWDMVDLVDGNAANGEIGTVPAADGGGWLEMILATNYDGAANPATAAFYFDNARLLPRVVTSEWKGGAPDPDNNTSNGNAAENFWWASQNWTVGVPGVADSVAVFGTNGGAITTPQTVTTDRLVTLGGMTFDNAAAAYTIGGTGSIAMQVASGSAAINVNAGNHTVNVPVALTSPTNVNVAGSNTLSVKRFTGAGLNIQQGAVRIIPDGTSAGTSKVTSLTIAGGATPSAKLDITNNGFAVDYTGASPLATVKAQVASGYAGGAWTGNGIVSSSANNSTHGVGYAEASAVFTSFPATFLGESVDNSSLLLRYTRYGDANLDGQVNLQDFNRLASAFGTTGTGVWSQGDFNYDGNVNLQDFNRLAGNFGLSAAGPTVTPEDWARLGAAVPEPASLALFGVAASAATTWRRRRRR